MEKMKRRSAWMRIMAVMLALVTGITMMPLDTMAAAGKDSGSYAINDCGCDDCHDHETCDCDDCHDRDDCACGECSGHDTTVSKTSNVSVESDDVTPDKSACSHTNIEYEASDCWFHYAVCKDCGKRFLENHDEPWYGTDGTCKCGLKVHNYGGYGDTHRTFAHEWSYEPYGDILHTKTCTKCGTSWLEGHNSNYDNNYVCDCGYDEKSATHAHYADWSTTEPLSFVNINCAIHSYTCDECGQRVVDLHGLAYETNEGKFCKCGAKVGGSGPTFHNSHEFQYVSVDSEIHQYVCSKCGEIYKKEIHQFYNDGSDKSDQCIACGYEREKNTVTPPAAATDLVYNGETQTGVPAGTGYTITGNTGKDAGDYTAIARLEDGYTWTDGSTDGKTIEWSIAPAELTEVILSETVFYYNGEVQRPDVVEVKAGDLIVPFEDYLVVYESGDTKDPGTYRVYVRKEFGKNNVTGGVWATYEIKKTVVPPIAKPGLVYNGREQEGVEPGEGYTLTGNTGKDAGDYTAEASLEDGYTWTDGSTGKKNIKWSIEPAELIELTLTETSFVYDGDVHVPLIKGIFTKDFLVVTDYTVEWSDKNSKEVGIYTITVKGFGNLTGTVSATYTISTDVTPPTAKTDLYYTGKEQTGVEAGKGYTIKDNTGTDAGSYKATATLDPGYTWTDGSTDDKEISWSIAPAELTSLGVTKTLFFYNGNVQKPEVTEVRAGSLIVPDTDYSLSWSDEQSTDVGFYTVEATATTNNFTGSATVTYEISDGIAKIPAAKTGLVYNGTMQTGVKPGTGYILWDNTELNAGKYTATATLEEGFEWNDGSKDPKTIDWSIERAPITNMTLSQTSFSYDGSVQKPRIKSVFAGPLQLETGDYTLAWSDENSKEVGMYSVTARGMNNFTGVSTKKYAIESMEAWNLFEDGSEHVYYTGGLTSKNEIQNSNSNSSKYFNASISKDAITVNLKEGAGRKKAAGANVFDFDLGGEGVISYTLPLTYDKPVLKLLSTKGTVKKGTDTTLQTTVLVQTENGNYVPYDLAGATVTYGNNAVTAGDNGQVFIKASAKASNKFVISKPGWNDKDPVALAYTISEVKADKEVLEIDMGSLKQVTLNTKAPDQSFTFPLTLNGEAATATTVTVEEGKKGEQNLASIGNGTVTFAIGRSGIGKGNYTVNFKAGTAKISVKVKVTEKAYTATGKIKQKYDVVTNKPMVLEPTLKEIEGTITGVTVSKVELKKGTPIPASSFEAVMNNGNIEVIYTGTEDMKASNLKIGDMTFTLTVADSSTGGTPVEVTMLVKGVSAKKTSPAAKAAKVVIPKSLAESADGTTVIGTANIISSYKDSAKHTQMMIPVSVALANKGVEAEVASYDQSRILIKKLDGKSGSIKATLTYPGGVTKTVTISVKKGK